MKAVQLNIKDWDRAVDPPKLSTRDVNLASLLGIVFLVMAALQVVSFNDFKAWLESAGLGAAATWAALIILAEVLAAVGFFRLRLSYGIRMLSSLAAVLVAGFWFVQNLRMVSDGQAGQLQNSGFFGQYLHQAPGWWTVLEVSVLLFWVVYCLNLASTALAKRR